jgi:hypothetical protein
MKFALEVVGAAEKFVLEYHFNQLFGSLRISLDNQLVKKKVQLFNEPLREVHQLELGRNERLAVRIEKERKILFGQRNRVFVNDRLVKTFEGV